MPNLSFTSSSKIFVDFSASPVGAGGLGSPGGAIWLQGISSFKDTDDRSKEIKKAIGVRGGAGYHRKQGGGTLAITELRAQKPQVNWRQLLRDEKIFMVMLQDENGGPRQKWLNVTVSKVDRSASDEGEHTDEIELKYLSTV